MKYIYTNRMEVALIATILIFAALLKTYHDATPTALSPSYESEQTWDA